MTRFHEPGAPTPSLVPMADDGRRPPSVSWDLTCEGRSLTAAPQGAILAIRWRSETEAAVRVDAADGSPIADVLVRITVAATDIQDEATNIAQAIYWSWWRARAMHGEI